MEDTRYEVDVFTEKSVGTQFPENSYCVDELASVTKIIEHCTDKLSGIKQVQVWINKSTEEFSEDHNEDFDFYKRMASKLLDKPEEEITLKERQSAKLEFLGKMYNKGADYGQEEPEAGC